MKERARRMLACPHCKEPVIIDGDAVVCTLCDRCFAFRDGVPVMIPEESLYEGRLQGFCAAPARSRSSLLRFLRRFRLPRPIAAYQTRQSRDRIADFVQRVSRDEDILNIGSGVTEFGDNVVNLDVGLFRGVDIVGDATQLPVLSGSLHAVITQGVLEHVRKPGLAIAEMHRVLTGGGLCYGEVPFMQPYHAVPTDYQRYTITGIEELFDRFECLEKGVILGPGSAMSWVAREFLAVLFSFNNLYLYRAGQRVFGWVTVPLKYLDAFLERNQFAPSMASGFYFVGRKAR